MPQRGRADRRLLQIAGDAAPPIVPDRWYAIARSRSVRRKPVTVQRLGRRLVLWRGARGEIVAQDARCPHRGADLGLGRVVNGEIECPYHGFRFAAGGACTAVPCEPAGAPIRRDLAVRSYEVREHRGLVWLWSGEGAPGDAPLPWFDELPDDDDRAWDHEEVWPLPQLRVLEGMLDLHHAPFAHRRFLGRMGALLDPYEVSVDGDTVRTHATLRRPDQPPDRGFRAGMDARLPGLIHARVGYRIQGVIACSPVDAEHTWIFARYFFDLPVLGKPIAALLLWAEFALVQPEDRAMLLSTWPREPHVADYRLVRADLGLAQWHKLFERALRDAGRPAEPAAPSAAPPAPANGSAPVEPPRLSAPVAPPRLSMQEG